MRVLSRYTPLGMAAGHVLEIGVDPGAAFDRMAREEAGLFLSINSVFRSDAEQARLFAANPNPHLFSAM